MLEPPDISTNAGWKMLMLYVTSFSRVHSKVAVTVLIPENPEILTTKFNGATYTIVINNFMSNKIRVYNLSVIWSFWFNDMSTVVSVFGVHTSVSV